MLCHIDERRSDKRGITNNLHRIYPPTFYTNKQTKQSSRAIYTHTLPLSLLINITTSTPTTTPHPIPRLPISNILTTPHPPNRSPQIPQSPTKTPPPSTRPPQPTLLICLRSPPTNRLTQLLARSDTKNAFSTSRHAICANAAGALEILHHCAECCAEGGCEEWSAGAGGA